MTLEKLLMAVSRGGALRIEQCEPVTMRIEGTITHTRSAGRRCRRCEELTLLACDCHSPRSPLHRDRAEAPIIRMVDPRASSFPADRFENRPPPGLYRYSGSHLALWCPLHWWAYKKTPARGYRGRVCLSDSDGTWLRSSSRRCRRLAASPASRIWARASRPPFETVVPLTSIAVPVIRQSVPPLPRHAHAER